MGDCQVQLDPFDEKLHTPSDIKKEHNKNSRQKEIITKKTKDYSGQRYTKQTYNPGGEEDALRFPVYVRVSS